MAMRLEPARWPGGSKHCPAANLPCFPDKKAAAIFLERNCPGGTVIAEWQCTQCGNYHFWSAGSGDPAGASSGSTRTGRNIEAVKERFAKTIAARTMP